MDDILEKMAQVLRYMLRSYIYKFRKRKASRAERDLKTSRNEVKKIALGDSRSKIHPIPVHVDMSSAVIKDDHKLPVKVLFLLHYS